MSSKIVEKKDKSDATENKVEKTELKIEDIENCPICKKWMAFCIAEPQEEDSKKTENWYREKQDYWDKNQEYLENKGFNYSAGMIKALDFVSVEKNNDLEGCLLVVKVGTEERPASPTDIEMAYQMLDKALDGVKGVRVIVTHHAFHIEKVSLPQLREIQSAVLTSTDMNDNSNPILRDLEV